MAQSTFAEMSAGVQGKWPSAATTPESTQNDRNAVSSVSFMHMATASHTAHDSPRQHPQARPGNGRGRATRSLSPANVLPMLRRSADASGRRRSRHRMTPVQGRVPAERPVSAHGPGSSGPTPPTLGHIHMHGVAVKRGPGRLRSRSSESTASPQQGTAHVTAGAVSDDTSITDHVTPEVSGVSIQGEATSSPGEAVSSLSGPENSIMLLQSVESVGGGTASAAVGGSGLARADEAPPPRRDGRDAVVAAAGSGAYSGTHGGPRSTSAVVRSSARRTYHINHTAADGTPFASPQAPQHLTPPSSGAGISPRPRSVGPAPSRQKELPVPLPRLRDTGVRLGGGPDSARDTGGSELGGSESITDERRYYGYGGRYHLHDVHERAASPSVSPVTTSASHRFRAGRDSRAPAAANTASLTRGQRSGSLRRTPRQLGTGPPGPPDSTQSHDGHAQSVLMRMEGPSSAGPDSSRVLGRQRSGSNLYSSAYPKTGASSGGIQACTMDALAVGPGSTGPHAVRSPTPLTLTPPLLAGQLGGTSVR